MRDTTTNLHTLRPRLQRWIPVWLLGWLALSLMQGIQPCCRNTVADDTHGAHSHVSAAHLQVAGMPHFDAGDPDHCDADAGPANHPALLSGAPANGKDLAKAPIAAAPPAGVREPPDLRLATIAPAPPAAQPPYLLTLRLRL